MTATAPLVSVIIPTYNRPQYLPRAVKSAFLAAPNGDVEVIVVPNGHDASWQESLRSWRSNPSVIISPVPPANANVARNHGLRLAKGQFLRFLDDDDYLLPEAANQLRQLATTCKDISCGAISLVNAEGATVTVIRPSQTSDLATNVLSANRRTGLQFYVYRSQCIKIFRFDETIIIGQDTHWTHELCRARTWDLDLFREPVCAWTQHSARQISRRYNRRKHLKLQVSMLRKTIETLDCRSTMDHAPAQAAAAGLWDLVHHGYLYEPWYWYKVISYTRRRFPRTYPKIPLYDHKVARFIGPTIIETLLLPKRWTNCLWRAFEILTNKRLFWE